MGSRAWERLRGSEKWPGRDRPRASAWGASPRSGAIYLSIYLSIYLYDHLCTLSLYYMYDLRGRGEARPASLLKELRVANTPITDAAAGASGSQGIF